MFSRETVFAAIAGNPRVDQYAVARPDRGDRAADILHYPRPVAAEYVGEPEGDAGKAGQGPEIQVIERRGLETHQHVAIVWEPGRGNVTDGERGEIAVGTHEQGLHRCAVRGARCAGVLLSMRFARTSNRAPRTSLLPECRREDDFRRGERWNRHGHRT